jgi:hypothetical protein
MAASTQKRRRKLGWQQRRSTRGAEIATGVNVDKVKPEQKKEEKSELEAGLWDEGMSEKLEKLLYILAVGALR